MRIAIAATHIMLWMAGLTAAHASDQAEAAWISTEAVSNFVAAVASADIAKIEAVGTNTFHEGYFLRDHGVFLAQFEARTTSDNPPRVVYILFRRDRPQAMQKDYAHLVVEKHSGRVLQFKCGTVLYD